MYGTRRPARCAAQSRAHPLPLPPFCHRSSHIRGHRTPRLVHSSKATGSAGQSVSIGNRIELCTSTNVNYIQHSCGCHGWLCQMCVKCMGVCVRIHVRDMMYVLRLCVTRTGTRRTAMHDRIIHRFLGDVWWNPLFLARIAEYFSRN